MIITTSWDDGDVEDMRVFELMERYGIRGTFYVARSYRPQTLSDAQIRTIAASQEVGAHTLTHPDLSTASSDMQQEEIRGSKTWLEQLLGKEVPMFCYPGGKFTDETVRLVKDAGYRGARTTRVGEFSYEFDPFKMGVSMTVYPRRDLTYGRRYVLPIVRAAFGEKALSGMFPLMEKRLLDRFEEARALDGIFHFYGHSWTNRYYGLYPVLERFFAHIAHYDGARYLTNGEINAELAI